MQLKIKKDHDIELAGVNREDLLVIEGIAFTDKVNSNGAVIFKEDAKKDIKTMVGKPLRILWNGNSPTGHGYDKFTNKFDSKVQNVGYIHSADVIDSDNDGYKACIQAIMWKRYYPEIAQRLIELDKENNLNFSIEAERKIEILKDGSRRCFNNNFIGLSMVSDPAWSESKSLMVAENENSQESNGAETTSDKNKVEAKEEKTTKTSSDKEFILESKIRDIENKKTIDGLNKKIAEYEKIISGYKIKDLGQERFDKLSKYTKVEDNLEDLGTMSESDFIKLFEKTVDSYVENLNKEEEKENDNAGSITALFDTRKKKEAKSPKESLLELLRNN